VAEHRLGHGVVVGATPLRFDDATFGRARGWRPSPRARDRCARWGSGAPRGGPGGREHDRLDGRRDLPGDRACRSPRDRVQAGGACSAKRRSREGEHCGQRTSRSIAGRRQIRSVVATSSRSWRGVKGRCAHGRGRYQSAGGRHETPMSCSQPALRTIGREPARAAGRTPSHLRAGVGRSHGGRRRRACRAACRRRAGLAARGYAAATVDDVIRSSATSRASFYRYFTGKQQLYEELSRACGRDMREAITSFAALGSRRDEPRSSSCWRATRA